MTSSLLTDAAPTSPAEPAASPLATAASVYATLTCPPFPLAVDCRRFDRRLDLPPRTVALPDLCRWLETHPHRRQARTAVWRHAVALARSGDPRWRVAVAGMSMPVLTRRARARAATGCPDPDGAVLTEFLAAIDAGRVDEGLNR